MSQLPFNTYDVFAYLASGSVVVSAADYLFGAQWFLREDHSAIFTLVLVFEIYLMGHIIATFSAAIFETVVVGRFLGQPSTLLMSENQSKAAWLFPLYYRPLPQVTRERIQQRLQENSFSDWNHRPQFLFGITLNPEEAISFKNELLFAENESKKVVSWRQSTQIQTSPYWSFLSHFALRQASFMPTRPIVEK